MIELPDDVMLIAAVGNQGQIGLNDKLPWPHDKKDMKWFQQVTKAADICIVGWKTAQTLPPLKDRNVVVDIPDITPKQFLQLHDHWLKPLDKIVIIGGAKTYARWMPHARTVLITKIDYDGPADTFMPEIWN